MMAKTLFVIALVAVGGVLLLIDGGPVGGRMFEVGPTGIDGHGGAEAGQSGWYWILMLVDVGLGLVVAWMLFGNRR